jgi:hypothetical protein
MRHLLVLMLACCLLAGCSAVRTVYNQADHVAAWRADDYFDLNDEQKRMFRGAFGRLHAWHRATQLEGYAGFLEAVHRRLQNGLAPQDIDWAYDRTEAYSRALVQRAYRDAAALLSTLSDHQVTVARKRFETDNRKFAREHGVGRPPAEQRRLRAKEHLEALEHWSGSLDFAQQERIGALSEALPLDAAPRHEDRIRRQREFLQLLAQRKEPGFPERLRDWLLDWNANRPPELEAQLRAYRQARDRMWLAAFEQLRPEQQRKVAERLTWYTNVMRDLARDAPQQHAETQSLPSGLVRP